MSDKKVSRRDFSSLALAAAGGMMAVSTTAMAKNRQEEGSETKEKKGFPVDPALLLSDPNVCKGLNTCGGKGKGEHDCAGKGSCATAGAHSCHGHNECKGQGGCGGYPGQNSCKETGHCAVPLSEKTWALAKKQLEHIMKDLGKMKEAVPSP